VSRPAPPPSNAAVAAIAHGDGSARPLAATPIAVSTTAIGANIASHASRRPRTSARSLFGVRIVSQSAVPSSAAW
jgi:hypothetical protein